MTRELAFKVYSMLQKIEDISNDIDTTNADIRYVEKINLSRAIKIDLTPLYNDIKEYELEIEKILEEIEKL